MFASDPFREIMKIILLAFSLFPEMQDDYKTNTECF